jgi:protein-S-isoprenylcysteine O-methyltransferase Ste14
VNPSQQAVIAASALNVHDPLRLLKHPQVDKAVAVIASVPYILLAWLQVSEGLFNIPRLVIVSHMLLQTITMFARRPPSRVASDWRFWFLALMASYWTFIAAPVTQIGGPLAPSWAGDAVSLLSLAVVVYARLSLGRNIGLVPARRRLVTHGAYALVRHPIYAGIFVAYVGLLLRAWSPVNLLLSATGCALFMVKSLVEEEFLAVDPDYRSYMRQVRRRWIPGLL